MNTKKKAFTVYDLTYWLLTVGFVLSCYNLFVLVLMSIKIGDLKGFVVILASMSILLSALKYGIDVYRPLRRVNR